MPGPLDGVRVVDLSTMVAGPVSTIMLADQGADVIKVESPSGDLMRHFAYGRSGMSASFLSCNRNKRSVAIDLKTLLDWRSFRSWFQRLTLWSITFVPEPPNESGWKKTLFVALNLTSSMCRSWLSESTSPYVGQRAYDPVIQALSGLAEIQRDRDARRPRMIRTIIADYTTALTAAQAISFTLFVRERTGQGQHVRIWMLDSMIAYLWPEAMPSLTFVGEEQDPSQGETGA